MKEYDDLTAEDLKARQQLMNSERYEKTVKVFGTPTWIPIPEDKRIQLDKSLERLNAVIYPTIRQLTNIKNVVEIQDRIYRMMKPYESKFCHCIVDSASVAEVRDCADTMIRHMDNEIKKETIKILREY